VKQTADVGYNADLTCTQHTNGEMSVHVCRLTQQDNFSGQCSVSAQGLEFTWLRPNRVVTRPGTAGSGGGVDFLWLRSRTIVKLDATRRAALEHSPEVRWSAPGRLSDGAPR